MTVNLELAPEIEAGLLTEAQAFGMTPARYLQLLLERELGAGVGESVRNERTGMIQENGLLVYKTGRPLPACVVDEAISSCREQRSRQLLGETV